MTDPTETKPALDAAVSRRADEQGGVMLVAAGRRAYLSVAARDVPVLGLLDGTRETSSVLAAAMALDVPAVPARVLGLLERLERAHMLAARDVARTSIFGAVSPGTTRLGAESERLAFVAAPGALIPPAVWTPFFVVAAVVTLAAAALAIGSGKAATAFSPWAPGASTVTVLAATWAGAAIALSIRSLARAWVLRSHDHQVLAAGAQLTLGVVHLTTDLRDLRAASRTVRMHAALAGLCAFGLTAAVASAVAFRDGSVWARGLSAASWLLLVFDTAPYLRTDARTLFGVVTRVRGVGRRSLAYVSSGARRAGALDAEERVVLAAATVAVLHGLTLLALLGFGLGPDTLSNAVDGWFALATDTSSGVDGALAVVAALVLLLVVGAIVLAMVVGVLRSVWALLWPAAVPADRDAHAANDTERALGALAALDALSPPDITDLVGHGQTVSLDAGDEHVVTDDAARALWLVVHGEVELRGGDGGATLNAGASAGVFADEPVPLAQHRFVARAPTQLLCVPFDRVRDALLGGAPALAERLSDRARSTSAVPSIGGRRR